MTDVKNAPAAAPSPVCTPDLFAAIDDPSTAWEPMRPGVEALWLYRWAAGPSAALLRYAPGGSMPRHLHVATEQILVLRGSQSDEDGIHGVGSLIVHPAGSSHSVRSDGGCVALAIWERPVVFG